MSSEKPLRTLLGQFAKSLRPKVFGALRRGNLPGTTLRPTDYLTGLRGWAALLVYISHHILDVTNAPIEMQYGFEERYYFVSFPLIRTLFTGSHMAVHIFFVLSGYVLSRRVLTMINDNSAPGDIVSSLATSICKRWIRLWGPIAGTTFLAMTMQYIAWDTPDRREKYYILQVIHWLDNFSKASFPFAGPAFMLSNPHTWTIPVEFKGSMYVFLALTATCRMTRKARMMIVLCIACWFHYGGVWQAATFLFGMVLSETDLSRYEDWPRWSLLRFLRSWKSTVLAIFMIFALHCAGQPRRLMIVNYDEYSESFGYHYMAQFIPRAYMNTPVDFYYSIGAVITVVVVSHSSLLKEIFETPWFQYLGQISYGLYLVHGPILLTVGTRLYVAVGARAHIPAVVAPWKDIWEFGKIGPVGLQLNFLCCHLILFPLTLYAAELVTEFLDEPSVRLADWLYRMVIIADSLYMPAATELEA